MIAAAIVVCEVAFWALLLSGLTARYLLGRVRLGALLLICVPLADVVLLAVTAIDLAGGGRADSTHGLAAFYLGFSVVFGPLFVRDADRRFARRFAGGPPAASPRARAEDRLAAHWRLWARCLLASGLACGVLGALVLVAGEPERTRALWAGGGWFAQLGVLCVLWLLLGPVWTGVSRHLRARASHPRAAERA
jgi:hypothetical protein